MDATDSPRDALTERLVAWASTGPPSRPDDVSVVFHGQPGRRASTEELIKAIAQVEADITNDIYDRDWAAWATEMRRLST